MKIKIHDLLHRSEHVYEGDPVTMERKLEEDYPWAVEGYEGDLNTILWNLDHTQSLAVEVVDATPHPFLKD